MASARRRAWRPLALTAPLVWALLGPELGAQIVTGKVVLASTGAPLGDVTVRLHFPDGRAVASAMTDTAGVFELTAPRLGWFTLSAERIGLAAVSTPELELRISEEVEVVLRMAEEAIPLEPLVVEARSAVQLGPLAGYFERMERQGKLGLGHILSRDQIDERAALDVADLLRDIPRVRVVQQRVGRPPSIVLVGRGGECTPKVYVDGIHQNRGGAAGTAAVVDELVRPSDLEGVEVYRGLDEMPGEYYEENHCGVMLR
ncbi:MAG: hypothetical protein FIA95_10605 [Gemmatimonadetes bacterium]|nr:hypothetical protein [Gemmatimonadota bacterium]